MHSHHHSLRALLLAGATLLAAAPAPAADVTPDRLVNADREPGNWLMNHRTYDAQRYSPLDKINRGNVKDVKLAYAVAIGGTSANENLESTPLAEDGFLYVVDQWGVLYKIDGRSGKAGRIVWRMDPVPMFNPHYRPGDNLYTNSLISWDPDSGKMNWYFQYTPGDMWDYDAAGTHILIDGEIAGQPRKLVTHAGRNGFFYALDRA